MRTEEVDTGEGLISLLIFKPSKERKDVLQMKSNAITR